MLKKILYHGGFATLGITLLLGMGVLQANGLKTSDDLTPDNESAISSPPDDTPAADVAVNTPSPEPVAPTAAKPIELASLPAGQAGLPPSTPAPKPVPEVAKNPLDDATAFSVYDTAHKTSSKKNFKTTTADLRHAKAYYEHLAHHHKHAVIKAHVNDAWVSVSAKDFNAYIKNSD